MVYVARRTVHGLLRKGAGRRAAAVVGCAAILVAAELVGVPPAFATGGPPTAVAVTYYPGAAYVTWSAPGDTTGLAQYIVASSEGWSARVGAAVTSAALHGLVTPSSDTYAVTADYGNGSCPVSSCQSASVAPSIGTTTATAFDLSVAATHVNSHPLMLGDNTVWTNPPHYQVPLYNSDINALKDRNAVMRFPGGAHANCYEWLLGVGPNQPRPNFSYEGDGTHAPYGACVPSITTDQATGAQVPRMDTFGTDEFMSYVNNLNATALVTINICSGGIAPGYFGPTFGSCVNTVGPGSGAIPGVGVGTQAATRTGTWSCPQPPDPAKPSQAVVCPGARDAANWVAYLNSSDMTNPMVRVRAANGHAAPYGVHYFELGNEVGQLSGYVDQSGQNNPNATVYLRVIHAFASAMKAVDGTIAIGAGTWDATDSAQSPGATDWDTALAQDSAVDFLIPHLYGLGKPSGFSNADSPVCQAAWDGHELANLRTTLGTAKEIVASELGYSSGLSPDDQVTMVATLKDAANIQSLLTNGATSGVLWVKELRQERGDGNGYTLPGYLFGMLAGATHPTLYNTTLTPTCADTSMWDGVQATASTTATQLDVQLVNFNAKDPRIVTVTTPRPVASASVNLMSGPPNQKDVTPAGTDGQIFPYKRTWTPPSNTSSITVVLPPDAVGVLSVQLT